jgi:hypothetical protein
MKRVYHKTLIHGSTVNCHNGRHQVMAAIAMRQKVPGSTNPAPVGQCPADAEKTWQRGHPVRVRCPSGM